MQEDLLEDDPENTDDSNPGNSDPLNDGHCSGGPLREQDRFLPIANVAKIMKRAIPEAGKIAKDARECVQECVSEFISFITSEASDRCHIEKRKTINGEDILYAMTSLGFDNYVDPLKIYLQKYREATKGESSSSGMVHGGVELKKDSDGNDLYEDQIFTIATSDPNQADTPIIYSYSAPDQLQFQLT